MNNFYTAREAAARLGVTVPSMGRLYRAGVVRGQKVSRQTILYDKVSVDVYAASERRPGRKKKVSEP